MNREVQIMGIEDMSGPPGSAHIDSSALMFSQAGTIPAQMGKLCQMWSPTHSPKQFAGCLLTKALVK